jgi:hypothetical protein
VKAGTSNGTRRGHDARAIEVGRWLEGADVLERSLLNGTSSENGL